MWGGRQKTGKRRTDREMSEERGRRGGEEGFGGGGMVRSQLNEEKKSGEGTGIWRIGGVG